MMLLAGISMVPNQASPQAQEVDLVALVVLAICSFLALGVGVVVLAFCLRYRRGSKADRSNPPENDIILELIWTLIPVALSVIMFSLGAKAYYDLFVPPQDGALEVEVEGEQWLWMIRHPGGRQEINTLHLPLGSKVRLKMISKDVIHSFYLPEFRTKHDVLPGRYSYLGLEPTKLGSFVLACSEYCGTDHSDMRGEVLVVRPEEYAAWAGQAGAESPQDRGRLLYQKLACASCHEGQIGATSPGAPVLAGIYGRTVAFENGGTTVVDDDYLRRSILRPRAEVVAGFKPLMPTYEGQLSEGDVMDLTAYIRSLESSPSRSLKEGKDGP